MMLIKKRNLALVDDAQAVMMKHYPILKANISENHRCRTVVDWGEIVPLSAHLVLDALGGVPDDGARGLPAGVGHQAAVARLDAGQRLAHAQVGRQAAGHASAGGGRRTGQPFQFFH